MKALLLAAMLVVVGVTPALAGERTVTLVVERMTCSACPITVGKAIGGVAGVSHVIVDYETGTAVITFDDQITTSSEVAAASTNAGYPAHTVE